jgi:hypothetical protein
MIWDIINAILAAILSVARGVYAALPQSPIYVDTSVIASITPLLHTVAWMFPVTGMIGFAAAYLGALLVVVLIQQVMAAMRFLAFLK